jgi:DNA modification methylase
VTTRIIIGDCRTALIGLADESVHCCVCSPPYYGLRDYGIEPQVWGGDDPERCATSHWVDDIRVGYGHDWADETQKRELKLVTRGFCRHCNAWRGSLGLEPSPALYVEHMVAVFREVRRVLRKDGTLWLNIGDSYSTTQSSQLAGKTGVRGNDNRTFRAIPMNTVGFPGIKPKDLLGIPWMLAFALRDDGWFLRSEITWAKRAPMPESVTDRPTSATEKVFLLTKSARYFYDAEAVKEDAEYGGEQLGIVRGQKRRAYAMGQEPSGNERPGADATIPSQRNIRNFWLLGPEPFPEAHFATFPTEIPRRAISAGTSARGVCPKCGAPWIRMVDKKFHPTQDPQFPKGGNKGLGQSNGWGETPRGINDTETIGWHPGCVCVGDDPNLPPVPATVLDPFFGAGTTGLVADQLQRHCIGIDLNPDYAAMAERRVRDDCPLFAYVSTHAASLGIAAE